MFFDHPIIDLWFMSTTVVQLGVAPPGYPHGAQRVQTGPVVFFYIIGTCYLR